jgi:DNA repair exonuclease SbcCD nuclease subunit
MRILISSDWQAEYSNHDQCVTAWEFILKQCKKYSLEAIVLAGDFGLKQLERLLKDILE